jgi:hypothetical protein
MEMPRSSAIIYPKDIAFLLMWAESFPALASSRQVSAPAPRDRAPAGHRPKRLPGYL